MLKKWHQPKNTADMQSFLTSRASYQRSMFWCKFWLKPGGPWSRMITRKGRGFTFPLCFTSCSVMRVSSWLLELYWEHWFGRCISQSTMSTKLRLESNQSWTKRTHTTRKRRKSSLRFVKSSKKTASFCPTQSSSDSSYRTNSTYKFSSDSKSSTSKKCQATETPTRKDRESFNRSFWIRRNT